MVGRKSESLSSLFQGLIRHLGISTSPLRAQLAGKGLGFVHRGGERTCCSLPSCCLNCFALSLPGPASRGSKERLRFAGEASHHRRGEPKGPGAHQPDPPHLPLPPVSEGIGKRLYFRRTCFPDPLASFHRSPCMRHRFMRLHRSPGAPFPSPFSLSHTEILFICL